MPVYGKLETIRELTEAATYLSLCKDIDQVQAYGNDIDEQDIATLQQVLPEGIPASCILLALLGWKLTDKPGPVEGSIVQCEMCARRLGLWSFLVNQPNDRRLNVIKEHKSYCPFINADTQRGEETSVKAGTQLSAWQQRLQVLSGNQTSSRQLLLSQEEVRKLRSSESLAKLKTIIM